MDPKTLFGIRNLAFGGVILLTFFDPSQGFRDFWGGWCQNVEFSTPQPMLRSKNVRSKTPPKVRFLMPNKVLGSKKKLRGPPKMKKTDFLINGESYILLKIKYGISEPHGDLLHWNLS